MPVVTGVGKQLAGRCSCSVFLCPIDTVNTCLDREEAVGFVAGDVMLKEVLES